MFEEENENLTFWGKVKERAEDVWFWSVDFVQNWIWPA